MAKGVSYASKLTTPTIMHETLQQQYRVQYTLQQQYHVQYCLGTEVVSKRAKRGEGGRRAVVKCDDDFPL